MSFSGISHTYLDDGVSPGNGTAQDGYTLSVTVNDDDGGSVSASTSVTVKNVAPTLSNVTSTSPVNEAQATTFSGSISDPGTLDAFTMVINWGDGSPNQTVNIAAGSTSFSVPHTYTDDNPSGTPADTYQVSIVSFVDDDNGSAGGTALRPNLMLSGGSSRNVATFVPAGVSLNVVSGSTPGANTQALLVSRSGAAALNPTVLQAYLNAGGIVITEFDISDDVFNKAFGTAIPQGSFQGNCLDQVNPVVQLNLSNPFWQALSGISPQPPGSAGCGYNLSALPGITPLGGWGSGTVQLAYRDLGAGRLWLVDADWQDTETTGAPYAASNTIMGYMITHGAAPPLPSANVTVNNIAPSSVSVTASPNTIDENGSVTLNASFIDPGTLDTHTVTINWGDGSANTVVNLAAGVLSIPTQSHQYLDDNPSGTSSDTYAISVTVADDDGGTGNGSTVVTVNNVAPTFEAGGDQTLQPPAAGSFSRLGTVFVDPGTLDTWIGSTVDYGDGAGPQALSVNPIAHTYNLSHTYTVQDEFTVTVKLKDDDGGETIDSFKVNVILNQPPTIAAASAAVTTPEGTPATNTGTFGDAQGTGTVTLAASVGVVTKNDALGTWLWSLPVVDGPAGPFTVTITATDNFGETAETSFTYSVNNVAPEIDAINLSATSIDEGQSVTVSGTFSDPARLVATESFTASALWSDGAITSVSVNQTAGTFTTTRSFPDDNPSGTAFDTFTVAITINDDDLGSDTETSPVLTVKNRAPQNLQISANSIDENGIVTVTGSFTDQGTQDTHQVYIDWRGDGPGEGSTTITTAGPNPLGTSLTFADGVWTFTATHQYLDDNPTGTRPTVIRSGSMSRMMTIK